MPLGNRIGGIKQKAGAAQAVFPGPAPENAVKFARQWQVSGSGFAFCTNGTSAV